MKVETISSVLLAVGKPVSRASVSKYILFGKMRPFDQSPQKPEKGMLRVGFSSEYRLIKPSVKKPLGNIMLLSERNLLSSAAFTPITTLLPGGTVISSQGFPSEVKDISALSVISSGRRVLRYLNSPVFLLVFL